MVKGTVSPSALAAETGFGQTTLWRCSQEALTGALATKGGLPPSATSLSAPAP